MDATRLNPIIREAAIYERIGKSAECVAYDCRLFYVICGELTVNIGQGKPQRLGPGDILYIPAGTPYRLKSQFLNAVVISFDPTDERPNPSERMPAVPVAEFDPALCHSVSEEAALSAPIHLTEQGAEEETLVRMCNLFTSGEGNYSARLSAMLKLLLVKIIEASDENALPSRLVDSLDAYIRENASEELSNTELGAIFGYHPFYISKLIKDKKGVTLHQYIISYRLKNAASLLRYSDRSINDVAERTGFSDASYFTKTFKGAYGMTPKEYRNKFKEDLI